MNGPLCLDNFSLALVGQFAGLSAVLVLSSSCACMRNRLGYGSPTWKSMRFEPSLAAFRSANLTIEGAEALHTRFQYIRDYIRANKNMAFRTACGAGNLPVAKWLASVFALTRCDATDNKNYALRVACHIKRLDIVVWLVETFDLARDDLFDKDGIALYVACASENMTLLFWLADRFGLTAADFCPRHMAIPSPAHPVGHQRVKRQLPHVQKAIARIAEVYGTGEDRGRGRRYTHHN